MKLGLGTVQFGLKYGITNHKGQTSAREVGNCLAYADAERITLIDTAALYGNAEQVIGEMLPRPHRFRIITKTRPLQPELPLPEALNSVMAGVHQSLNLLKEHRLAGLLIHRPDDLLGPNGDALFNCLDEMKSDGIIEKIGVSLYTPNEVLAVLARYPVDLVQLPLNPLDQRHLTRGTLAALEEAGVEIHIRSAFLQGLLLADPATPHGGAEALAPFIQSWQALLKRENIAPITACLGFLKGIPQISIAVCGATNLAEWQAIVAAYHSTPDIPTKLFKYLAVADDNLIDPRYWSK